MDAARRFETDVLGDVVDGGLLSPGDRVIVAVSGGADSMALLTVLAALGTRHGLPLELQVAHFDHGLRPESARRDAAFVEAAARGRGLSFHVGRTDALRADDANLEESARELRGAFLAGVARATSARAIALGHTLDDQAETVVHRLARGAGVRALAAMDASRDDGLVRPLLRRRREDCRRYLGQLGVEYVEDPTNGDRRFTRNRIRLDLLPTLSESLGVDVSERLARMADELRAEAHLADREVARILGDVAEVLAVRTLAPGGAVGRRIAHAWLTRLGVRASHRQVDAIVRVAAAENPSAGVDVTGGRVRRVYGRLVFEPAGDRPSPDVSGSLAWPAPGEVRLESGWRLRALPEQRRPGAPADGDVVVDGARLAPELVVRTMRPGDRIRLAAGRRKLSDLFTDRKIPRIERGRLAVVTSGADIVWVPGVAVAADVLPGDDTKRRIRLRAELVDCRVSGTMLENQAFRVRFG